MSTLQTPSESAPQPVRGADVALLAGTFVIAICGLIYELLAGTLSSYLLGDSVYHFSLVIGLFLTAMGLGSFLSRYVQRDLTAAFVKIQLAIAVIGGSSALVLFFAFVQLESLQVFLYLEVLAAGTLVGMEIPIVLRLLKEHFSLRVNVSNVLTADYLGALAASLLFPLVLVPQLGLIRTGLLFGLLNAAVAVLGIWLFRSDAATRRLAFPTGAVVGLLILGMVFAGRASSHLENRLYSDEIVYATSTPYQRIVLTRSNGGDIRLFLNGSIQFSSKDEYRYHESLVHPAMSAATRRQRVLILGGGDGLALREVLKYQDLGSVTLVDLDPAMTRLFSSNELLRALNKDSLRHEKARIIHEDAWTFLDRNDEQPFDVVIIDLPDPHGPALSKLYTRSFYKKLLGRMAVDAVMVTQATSPLFGREAFWMVAHTMAAAEHPVRPKGDIHVRPYHVYVPSFGEWGFVLASPRKVTWPMALKQRGLRFLNEVQLDAMDDFPPDMAEVETDINRVDSHRLMAVYEEGWRRWYGE